MYRTPCSIEELRKIIRLDEKTGRLYWLERDESMFNAKPSYLGRLKDRWNKAYAGKEALTAIMRDGYRKGTICGVGILAHRVVWALHHGEWPRKRIDHFNGNPSDNRPENLRTVSHSENCRNRSMQSNNTSGVMGVSFCKTHQKWRACIKHDGKQLSLGYHDDKASAIEARERGLRDYDYHHLHGRPQIKSRQA